MLPLSRPNLIVLIVEDEPMAANVLGRGLATCGLTSKPLFAANGRIALQMIDELGEEVQLIITDGCMPEMSGPELIEKLRTRPYGGKIITTTGDLVNEELFKSLGLPFLFKPYRLEALVEIINQLCPAQ